MGSRWPFADACAALDSPDSAWLGKMRGMRPPAAGEKGPGVAPNRFLATIGEGRARRVYPTSRAIYAQGDEANAIFYVLNGKVRLSVVSQAGKEATIGLVSEGGFFGEGALAGQTHRTGSASAMTECELLRVDKKPMIVALRRERSLSDLFVAFLLARKIRSEEDLVDQLFNLSEERLARALLLLAHFGKVTGRAPCFD